jgi:thymidylate synthase (FAD)
MNKNHVQLLDSMGDDLTVVNAARVSMSKVSDSLTPEDEKLIRYLAKHEHWTPFSQVVFQFRIKMPIFVARQYFKHMIGLTKNEVSRRYVSDAPEFWEPTEWRSRAANVKQGSGSKLEGPILDEINAYYRRAMESCEQMYNALLNCNVAPEQARSVLPQSMMTEFIETGSLAAYARICKLRLDPHAQAETRMYAERISALIEPKVPVSWAALMNKEK